MSPIAAARKRQRLDNGLTLYNRPQVKKQELCKLIDPRPTLREGKGNVRFRIDDVSRKHQVCSYWERTIQWLIPSLTVLICCIPEPVCLRVVGWCGWVRMRVC